MPLISDFLVDLDRRWDPRSGGKVRLPLIGSTALMLQADYERRTKDGDVLETAELTTEIKKRLLGLAGEGSEMHTRWRLYLEVVAAALPFLPQHPRWHPVADLNSSLQRFSVEVLDVVDVVVSKLKRFNLHDVEDIAAMVDRSLVSHGDLISRFRMAVDGYSMDSRADDLPKYVANLHRVERDLFELAPTDIELPNWIG